VPSRTPRRVGEDGVPRAHTHPPPSDTAPRIGLLGCVVLGAASPAWEVPSVPGATAATLGVVRCAAPSCAARQAPPAPSISERDADPTDSAMAYASKIHLTPHERSAL